MDETTIIIDESGEKLIIINAVKSVWEELTAKEKIKNLDFDAILIRELKEKVSGRSFGMSTLMIEEALKE